jgi:hypothetical protein
MKTYLHIAQAFGNNMFNVPLLFTLPEIKGVAQRVSDRIGAAVTPTQVL